MATEDFPVERIHSIALASALLWLAVTVCAHVFMLLVWRGYAQLPTRDKLNFCNRIASAAHVRDDILPGVAAVLPGVFCSTCRDALLSVGRPTAC
jgi:hypothetical protein